MTKILKIYSFLFLFLFLTIGVAGIAKADDNTVMGTEKTVNTVPPAGSKPVDIDNPLGKIDTPQKLIGQIINSILGLVGSVALVMFIWGGFQWMTAAGNSDKIEKGRATLMWAALGLVIIFSSYALVSYLIKDVIKGGS